GQKLVALAGEERIGSHNQRIAPLAHQRLEGCVDLALGTGIEKNELAPKCTCGLLLIRKLSSRFRTFRVHEHPDGICMGKQLLWEPEPLCCDFVGEPVHPRDVTARSVEAGN